MGTLNGVNENNITTIGGVQVGNKLRVNGLIETNQLKIIANPSNAGLAGFEILNSNNSMIAKFYDDYHCDLGATNVLGNLYCSNPIDAYRFTPTEIVQRDVNPLLIKNKNNITAIQIDELVVDIQQPFKVTSSTNSSFAYGASFGVLLPTASLGVNCHSSANVGGNLSVIGSTNLTGNLEVTRLDATGNGNVKISATNTGSSGFTSLYLHTSNQISPIINETAQIFVGQNVGMFLHTRTNHPITFQTYSDQPATTVIPSMKILSTGTRDVEINAPLIVNNNVTINGFLAAKPYISLKVSTSLYSSGTILAVPSTSSVIGTPGAVTLTNVGYQQSATVGRGTVGNVNYFLYTFTFPAHPLGSSYGVGCTFNTGSTSSTNPNAIITTNNTSTQITLWIREITTNILRDGTFYVYSVP